MSRIMKVLAGLGIAALALTGCEAATTQSDASNRDKAHDQMESSQAAKTMDYSPTRETINFWVDTWDEPGKLSYVYLQNNTGDMLGYYVLEGLPVSYCAQISPTTEVYGSSNSRVVVPTPANDGAYYSGGGSCNTYYGKDATTGAYIEYTAGLGINVLLFDQPLPNSNGIEPLGGTSVDDIE